MAFLMSMMFLLLGSAGRSGDKKRQSELGIVRSHNGSYARWRVKSASEGEIASGLTRKVSGGPQLQAT